MNTSKKIYMFGKSFQPLHLKLLTFKSHIYMSLQTANVFIIISCKVMGSVRLKLEASEFVLHIYKLIREWIKCFQVNYT